jgi:hypothetical protein
MGKCNWERMMLSDPERERVFTNTRAVMIQAKTIRIMVLLGGFCNKKRIARKGTNPKIILMGRMLWLFRK